MNNTEYPIQETTNQTVISNIEEMSVFLENLQGSASDSVEEALKAQLMVIKYVQSPTLVDTTFDSILACLDKAIKYSNSNKEQDLIRERFQIMLLNYVFFFDARLQVEIDANKAEGKRLLEEAGEMLSKSITDVATLVSTGSASGIKNCGKLVVKNIFLESTKQKDNGSFLTRIIKWWNKESDIRIKKEEFAKTISELMFKLEKYQKLIGPSILISGLIRRYGDIVTDYKMSDKIKGIPKFRSILV